MAFCLVSISHWPSQNKGLHGNGRQDIGLDSTTGEGDIKREREGGGGGLTDIQTLRIVEILGDKKTVLKYYQRKKKRTKCGESIDIFRES